MLERLAERGARAAAERVEATVRDREDRLTAALPPGVGCERTNEGLVLSGRELKRRYVLDRELRELLGRGT